MFQARAGIICQLARRTDKNSLRVENSIFDISSPFAASQRPLTQA